MFFAIMDLLDGLETHFFGGQLIKTLSLREAHILHKWQYWHSLPCYLCVLTSVPS